MNKMLVAVFDREATAFEGMSALKELHRSGDISLYSSAVIAKDTAGKIELKQAADAGPVGIAVGLLTGSLSAFSAGLPEWLSAPRLAASRAWCSTRTRAALT